MMFKVWDAIFWSGRVIGLDINSCCWDDACWYLARLQYYPINVGTPGSTSLVGFSRDRFAVTLRCCQAPEKLVMFGLNALQQQELLALMECKAIGGSRSVIRKLPVELFRMLVPFLYADNQPSKMTRYIPDKPRKKRKKTRVPATKHTEPLSPGYSMSFIIAEWLAMVLVILTLGTMTSKLRM